MNNLYEEKILQLAREITAARLQAASAAAILEEERKNARPYVSIGNLWYSRDGRGGFEYREPTLGSPWRGGIGHINSEYDILRLATWVNTQRGLHE